MNLWEIITSNSTLQVQAGNNFWDHLNNQQGGDGDVFLLSGGFGLKAEIEEISLTAAVDEQIFLINVEESSVIVDDNKTSVIAKIDQVTI